MNSMKITTTTKEYLNVHKKKNIDNSINELMDFVEPLLDEYYVPVERDHVVKVNKDTMDRIKSFRVSEHESYDAILRRLLYIADQNNYI